VKKAHRLIASTQSDQAHFLARATFREMDVGIRQRAAVAQVAKSFDRFTTPTKPNPKLVEFEPQRITRTGSALADGTGGSLLAEPLKPFSTRKSMAPR